MPLEPTKPEDVPARGETAEVVRHFGHTINRVLDFLGYTIDEVVNDPLKKEHVKRAYLLSMRIDRDLRSEPWRSRPTERLGEVLGRKLGFPE